MARRFKYTIEQVETALRLASGLRTHAAKQLDCSCTTVSLYVKRSKHLQQVEAEIVEQTLDFCEAQLIRNAKAGKELSLFKYLDCKGSQRGYGRQQLVVENTGLGGGPIRHLHQLGPRVDVDAMTDDEVDEYLASRRIGPPAD